MPQLSTNPVLLWDCFFQTWQPALTPSFLWENDLWAEHGNTLHNIHSKNCALLFCIKLCTDQSEGIAQTLPFQHQTCENRGPCSVQLNILESWVAVFLWALSVNSCRQRWCPRAMPGEQRAAGDLDLWIKLDRGGFGKILTIGLSFLTVWFKIWLARTAIVLLFDLLDGEKTWNFQAELCKTFLSPIRLEHTPQITTSWTRQVLLKHLVSSHPNILESSKLNHYNSILTYFTAIFIVQLGGGWGSCWND